MHGCSETSVLFYSRLQTFSSFFRPLSSQPLNFHIRTMSQIIPRIRRSCCAFGKPEMLSSFSEFYFLSLEKDQVLCLGERNVCSHLWFVFSEGFNPGHGPTNYKKWKEAKDPYTVRWCPVCVRLLVGPAPVDLSGIFLSFFWNCQPHVPHRILFQAPATKFLSPKLNKILFVLDYRL